MYNLEDDEKKTLLALEKLQKMPIQVTLIPSDHEQNPFFEAFCEALLQCTSKIKLIKATDKKELPAIVLQENMVFHAIPQGKIFSSFIEALLASSSSSSSNSSSSSSSSSSSNSSSSSSSNSSATPSSYPKLPNVLHLSPKTAANLSRIEVPVELKLYIANQCPHCPGVLNTLLSLAAACSQIHLKIIDGTLFTDHALKNNVLSAPCLILDNDFRWSGGATPEEITDMIINRDPSVLSTSSLRMILEDGKADWIVRRMMEHNSIFPGFTGLVTHGIWSVRLGAMVVLEELAEKAPELAVQIGQELLKYFNDSDTPIQGDILYALGETGDERIKQKIIELMGKLNEPDLIEAAQEAVDAIEARE